MIKTLDKAGLSLPSLSGFTRNLHVIVRYWGLTSFPFVNIPRTFASIRHYSQFLVSFRHYLSLVVTIRDHLSLFVTIRHYSPLFVTIRNYSALFATIRDYSRLFVSVRHYSQLFVTIRQYLLFAIRDYSLFAIRVFQTPRREIDRNLKTIRMNCSSSETVS